MIVKCAVLRVGVPLVRSVFWREKTLRSTRVGSGTRFRVGNGGFRKNLVS